MTNARDYRKTGAVLGVLVLSLMVVRGGGWLISSRSLPQAEARWLAVSVAPLERRIGLVGRIVPGTSLTLTAPFDAMVLDRPTQDDQRVDKGQRLLLLDTELLQIQLRDALAERLKAQSAVQLLDGWATGEEMARARRALGNAQLSLADTKRKLAETRSLLAEGIVPRMEVDSLAQQVNTQRLDLKAAQDELGHVSKRGQGEHRQIADMQLANARARHDALLALEQRSELTAPFAGILVRLQGSGSADATEKPVQAGARVSQGQSLFTLASHEQLSVQAKVNEADINQLREGMPVDISGDGFDGLHLRGRISSVGAEAVASEMGGDSASYHISVALPALDQAQQTRLRLGMSARLSALVYQNSAAVVLPVDAIGEQGGEHFVIHRHEPEHPSQRMAITLGRATAEGIEVFGLNHGFVQREVSMD
jgi:multidrug efflux pump subunit AcrA (membrane-fusion protein)